MRLCTKVVGRIHATLFVVLVLNVLLFYASYHLIAAQSYQLKCYAFKRTNFVAAMAPPCHLKNDQANLWKRVRAAIP